jgi:hypothetical protein
MGYSIKAFANQRRQGADYNNGTEFFRLIQVICMGSIVSPDILPTVEASDLPEHARQEDRLLELNSELLKFIHALSFLYKLCSITFTTGYA